MIWSLMFLSLVSKSEVTFETIDIQVSNKKIHAKLADDDEKRERGLMKVTKLGPNEGMLFVFDDERVLNFWMKDTLLDLSIGYFDSEGKLVSKAEMESHPMDKEQKTYSSNAPALFALEMPQNWFTKNHVEIGAQLAVLRGGKSALLKQKVQFHTRQTSSKHSH
jgi:uncharacterized membrane protein (UPF0127 family)